MTVYERIPEIFPRDDFKIAQEMYNRVRDNAILWFDAIGDNVGRTNKRRDEEDDGLRIIDAQYMEYERDVLARINPERDERYKNTGVGMYNRAIHDYIIEKGYGYNEKCYQEMKEEVIKNMDADYYFRYDNSKKIYEQNMLEETKNIIGYIYYNYWANEQEKNDFKNSVVNNSI